MKKISFNLDDEIITILNDLNVPVTEDLIYYIKSIINPAIYYKDINIDNAKLIDYNTKIESKYLSIGLNNCTKATILCATIGEEFCTSIEDAFKRNEFFKSALLNEVGSYGVEFLVDKFHSYLKKEKMKKGLHGTPRFSPGYGDFDLNYQSDIINIIGIDDIRVTDSNIMYPIKSISAVIGWSYDFINQDYPTGEKGKGLCKSSATCSNCKTWACKI